MATLYRWKKYKVNQNSYYIEDKETINKLWTIVFYHDDLLVFSNYTKKNGLYYGDNSKSTGLYVICDSYELAGGSYQNIRCEAKSLGKYLMYVKEFSHSIKYELAKEEVYYQKQQTDYYKGDYVSNTTSTNRNAYPNNGKSGSYWYVYDGLANQPPTISGSNLDLGSKIDDFNIDYIVTDPDSGDVIKVDIYEDSKLVVENKTVSVGIKYNHLVKLENFTLGQHTVKIIAKDSLGETDTRIYTFYKSNSAPLISGQDMNLGEKNSAFSHKFTVSDQNDDSVAVTVTLNGIEINNISNAQNKEHIITISDEMLSKLVIGKENIILIKADDGKTGVTYRKLIFTRVNKPPIISGNDTHLGVKDKPFEIAYSITDLEKDVISCEIYIDNKLVETKEEVKDGVEQKYKIERDEFIRLSKGEHTFKIIAADDKGGKSERVFTFEKKVMKMEFILILKNTDIAVTKVLAIINGAIQSADELTLKASNNYDDATPTWEDITAKALVKLVYQMANNSKTAEEWKLAIWVKTEKKTEEGRSVIRGISGGYE